MIRRRRLPLRLLLACLVLAFQATARANPETAHESPLDKHDAPAASKHGSSKEAPAPTVALPTDKPHVAAPEKSPAEHEPAHVAEPAAKRSEPAPATSKHEVGAKAHEPEPEKPGTKGGKAEKPEKTEKSASTAEEARGLLKLGAALTERGDYDAAEIAYRQILNSPLFSPEDTKTALLNLAHMHRRQGTLTKAVAIYEKFLKDFPGDERTPDAYLDLGRTLRTMGAYKLAIARFYNVINSTLKLPTSEGFAHYQLLAKTAQFEIAETHFQSGNFADAAKYFSRLRLLELAPADRARATFKSAYALRLQGELENAVTAFKGYIEQWPDDENIPEARYLLAVTLRELKRTQEAFRTVLDLLHAEKSRVAADPKRWAYWQRRTGNQLANDFFETGDMLNAHAIYTGLVELSPEPVWRLPIIYQIALCYERLGLPERAKASYQSIIDGAGTNADLAELARMSTWRMEHLAWRDQVEHQVTVFFESSTGKTPPPTATSAPKPPAAPELSLAKAGTNP